MSNGDVWGRRQFLTGTLLAGGVVLVGRLPAAEAAVGPAISDCATWGAQPAHAAITVLPQRPTKIIVHHTDSPNSTDYSQAHAFALSRSIQQSHFSRGWIDTGQHLTISRGGFITEGRHRSLSALQAGTQQVVSAHCTGQNEVAIGIENEGNYMTTQIRAQHYSALVTTCVYICRQYGIAPSQLYGHRDFNSTDCPGDLLYAKLPQLRQDVAAQVGGNPAGPIWPVVRSGNSGERVKTVQYLLRQDGAGITADGDFGPATESAVRAFQSSHGAGVDGVVGGQSWNQLVLQLGTGSSGEAVRAVQSRLGIAVDGQFGSGTQASVRSFQTAHSRPATGIVDPNTWAALVA